MTEHELVAESAVVGFPHPVKGEGVYAYVILKEEQNRNFCRIIFWRNFEILVTPMLVTEFIYAGDIIGILVQDGCLKNDMFWS